MTEAKILVLDIERQGALIDDVWEGRQYRNWIGPERTIEPSRTICFAYRWEHEPRTRFTAEWDVDFVQDNTSPAPGGGHYLMIKKAHHLLDEADYVVGWNSKNFDIKHLRANFYAYDMQPPSPHTDIDLMLQCSKNFALPAKSMAYVSKMKGMAGKLKNEPNLRRKLRYADGDILRRAQRSMKRYNIQDVNQTLELFNDQRAWLSGLNLGLHADDGKLHCSNCGGTHLQYRGVAGNRTYAYKRFQCQSCGKWGRDSKSFKSTSVVGIS